MKKKQCTHWTKIKEQMFEFSEGFRSKMESISNMEVSQKLTERFYENCLLVGLDPQIKCYSIWRDPEAHLDPDP